MTHELVIGNEGYIAHLRHCMIIRSIPTVTTKPSCSLEHLRSKSRRIWTDIKYISKYYSL